MSWPRSDCKFSFGDNPCREIEVQCGSIISLSPSLVLWTQMLGGYEAVGAILNIKTRQDGGGWRGIKAEEEAAEVG